MLSRGLSAAAVRGARACLAPLKRNMVPHNSIKMCPTTVSTSYASPMSSASARYASTLVCALPFLSCSPWTEQWSPSLTAIFLALSCIEWNNKYLTSCIFHCSMNEWVQIVAEHDNENVAAGTLSAVTAAKAFGGDVRSTYCSIWALSHGYLCCLLVVRTDYRPCSRTQ